MRVLVRLAADRLLVILVLLLHGGVLSPSIARTTVAAATVHVKETELQRSLAQYRLLLDHVPSEELEIHAEGEARKEIKTNNDPETKGDAVQAGVELQVEKIDTSEIELPIEAITSQTIKKQTGEHQPQPDDSVEKTQEPNLRPENEGEVAQQQIGEQVRSVVKNREEAEPHIEEQHVQGDEQKRVAADEIQLEHHELMEEPEATATKQHTEEKTETVSKAEEKNLTDGKEFESKTNEQSTEKKTESVDSTTGDDAKDEESQPKTEEEKPAEDEPFVFPENYLLGPKITDWDEQRGNWLNSNPHMRTTSGGKSRVLIVTGSQPNPCHSPVGDFFNAKSFKLKVDYARMHNYEIYYNFAWLDPLFDSYWVKLPTLRKLMLTHPEIEWFFWIDSDAVFTDMIFEAPFDTYDAEGANMVMWAYHEGFYVRKSWVAFNAGVFIIRNCQWSLDLIDKWSPMGPSGRVRFEYGKILTSYLADRPEKYPADDQSALAYLILTDEAVESKVKFVNLVDYMISAWWIEVVDSYDTLMEKYHPGLGDWRWPWITHFTGCGPCNGDSVSDNYRKCMMHIERAFNFAENQVLAYMGFQHESLSSDSLIRTRNETDRPLASLGVNPWQERIAQLAAASASA